MKNFDCRKCIRLCKQMHWQSYEGDSDYCGAYIELDSPECNAIFAKIHEVEEILTR